MWILASASPRRKELLADIITEFEVIPSKADETVVEKLSPKAFVKTLATRKALEVACRPENEGKYVLGADTIVVYGKEILGKPTDGADAFRMLKLLSGEKHFVYTGVCICVCKDGKVAFTTKAVKTKVYFNELENNWTWSYIRGGSPMDKAGAYGIQDGGLVSKIKGSYSNVVGLPVELCTKMINKVNSGKKAFNAYLPLSLLEK